MPPKPVGPLTALFILGVSGVGKTSLADALAEDVNWVAFHGGRRLVDWAQTRNDIDLLGELRQQRPVPAPLFLEIVESAAEAIRNRHVAFDGFPRNLEHLAVVDRVCEILATPAGPRRAIFVVLRAPDHIVRTRLISRFECTNCGKSGGAEFVCPSCNMMAAHRKSQSRGRQDSDLNIAKMVAALEEQAVHLWELDSSHEITTTLSNLERLLGLSSSLEASGVTSYLPAVVLPSTSRRVMEEVTLFIDALRLADVRRFFHQRYFEEEGRAAGYADLIEPLPKLENVAAHSWHVSDGVLLFGPRLPDIDYRHALELAVLHDKMEMFIGDKDPIGRDGTGRKAHAFNQDSKKRKRELEEEAIDRYVSRLREPVRSRQASLLHEALQCESPEASFVKSIDKLAALTFILIKKAGRTSDKHLHLLHALTLRNMTFYPPLAEHHREVLRRILGSVAAVRELTVEALCDDISKGQGTLF
jgi:5'-deoxynucleotidase YfbR-like HD superfamily hydrolase/adenylate kinase family enzyme